MGTKDKPSFTMRMTPEDEERFDFLTKFYEATATSIVRQYLKQDADAKGFTPSTKGTAASKKPTKRTAAKK